MAGFIQYVVDKAVDLGRRNLGALTVLATVALVLFLIFRADPKASAAVTIDDPSIWFETASAGVIVEVNTSSHDVAATVKVGEPGQRLSAHTGSQSIAVANHDTRLMSIVDRATHRITHLLDLGTSPGDIELHGDGDTVVVVGEARVDRVDLKTVEHTVLGFTGGIASAGIDATGEVAAIDGGGQAIHFMGPDEDEFTREIELAATATVPTLTRVGPDIVIVDHTRLQTRRINDRALEAGRCLSHRADDPKVGIATSTADELAIVDAARPALLLSPATRSNGSACRQLDLDVPPGSQFGSPVVHGNTVYVPDWTSGEVLRLDLTTGDESPVPFVAPGVEFEVRVASGTVWANDPLGRMAAVVDVDRPSRLIPKFSLASGRGGDQGSRRGLGLSMVGNDGSRNGVTVLDEEGNPIAGLDDDVADDLVSTTTLAVTPPASDLPTTLPQSTTSSSTTTTTAAPSSTTVLVPTTVDVAGVVISTTVAPATTSAPAAPPASTTTTILVGAPSTDSTPGTSTTSTTSIPAPAAADPATTSTTAPTTVSTTSTTTTTTTTVPPTTTTSPPSTTTTTSAPTTTTTTTTTEAPTTTSPPTTAAPTTTTTTAAPTTTTTTAAPTTTTTEAPADP